MLSQFAVSAIDKYGGSELTSRFVWDPYAGLVLNLLDFPLILVTAYADYTIASSRH
jgi:hypothetical protein